MRIQLDNTSSFCGLTFYNLHLKPIQDYLYRRSEISISFPNSRTAVMESKYAFTSTGVQEEVQKIESQYQKELLAVTASLKKQEEEEILMEKLKQFDASLVKPLFNKYLKVAEPNYKELSAYTSFDINHNKWVYNPSYPILGRLAAFLRNLVDFFSRRQSKIRIANTVLESLSLTNTSTSVSSGIAADSEKAQNIVPIIKNAIESNKALDSESGRLGALLTYSLFAYSKSEGPQISKSELSNETIKVLSSLICA